MVTWMMLMIGFATVREAGLKISEHLEPGWARISLFQN